jgi:hypothetical protein
MVAAVPLPPQSRKAQEVLIQQAILMARRRKTLAQPDSSQASPSRGAQSRKIHHKEIKRRWA